MKLIVGLGNPGLEYQNTRHNAGFMVIDRLAKTHAPGAPVKGQFNASVVDATIAGERCLLVKPNTYMNLSGRSVGEAVRFYKVKPLTDLLVVVDDIYLDVGQVRLKPSGGTGGHNGLESLRQSLGTDHYPRLRVGVGNKPAVMDQADWVLSRFTADERPVLDRAVEQSAKACEVFAAKGIDAAMNQFNAPERPDKSDKAERPRQPREPGPKPNTDGQPPPRPPDPSPAAP